MDQGACTQASKHAAQRQHAETLRQVGGYTEFLESLLEHHSSPGEVNHSSLDTFAGLSYAVDFRAFRPIVFEELVSPCVRSENVELDFISTYRNY